MKKLIKLISDIEKGQFGTKNRSVLLSRLTDIYNELIKLTNKR